VKKILLGVVVFAALICAMGPLLPRYAQVGRRVTIDAPPEVVFADVGDLSKWPDWTEWNTTNDPIYDPKAEGPSKLVWTQSETGGGSQVLTEADPQKGVRYKIVVQGGQVVVDGRIMFTRQGDKTAVTWIDEVGFHGSFVARYFTPFMDALMGPKLAKSLLSLKSRSEARAKVQPLPVAGTAPIPSVGGVPDVPNEPNDLVDKEAPPEPKPELATPPEDVKPTPAVIDAGSPAAEVAADAVDSGTP
jgi:hypothetical protein